MNRFSEGELGESRSEHLPAFCSLRVLGGGGGGGGWSDIQRQLLPFGGRATENRPLRYSK